MSSRDGGWYFTWPVKPGLYWFYGYVTNKAIDKFPRLHLVVVEYKSKLFGTVYRTGRTSLHQETGSYGMWKTIDVPELPPITEQFEQRAEAESRKMKPLKDLEFLNE
jgi:hypothetical protein